MVECQARDLEVQVRVPVQVQIFLFKCDKDNVLFIFITYFSSIQLIMTVEK